MKMSSTGLAIFFYLLIFSPDSNQVESPSIWQNETLLSNQVMCSSRNGEAKCTGSAYCRACKNCRYCGHCNSGGSCGVCGKKPKSYYSTPKKKKEKKRTSTKPKTNRDSSIDLKTSVTQEGEKYIVIQNTSLRISGDSRSKVLKRLQLDEVVVVIDSSDEYWWEVICNKKVGWVKKHLLKKKMELP